MKKYENCGITSKLTEKKLTIEISIKNLISAFELSPNNFDKSKVKRDKRNEFAEFVAEHIIEKCDSETGDTYMTDAFDRVFDLLLEGYEDGRDFIKFGEEDE